MPGRISGRITLRNAWKGVAPNRSAPHSTFWFILFVRLGGMDTQHHIGRAERDMRQHDRRESL